MYSSKILRKKEELDAYLDYIIEAIEYYAPVFRGHDMSNMFIGGGTPSLLEKRQIERLLNAANNNFRHISGCSRTCEVSPSTATKQKLKAMKEQGINRISVGVQSFNEKTMRLAGRKYVAYEEILVLMEKIKELGFEQINLDLMGGLPFETKEDFAANFEKALALEPTTITTYFFRAANNVRYPERIIQEYVSANKNEHRAAVVEMLEKAASRRGFIRNNVSCFALSQGFINSECESAPNEFRTNWNAREGNSCLGIGIGARSFLLDIAECFDVGPGGKNDRQICEILEGDIDFKKSNYLIVSHDKRKRMRNYVVRELYRNGVADLNLFSSIYREDALEVFRDAVDALQQLGKIELGGSSIFSRIEGENEWNIYSKFFFTEEELEHIQMRKGPYVMYS